MPNPYRVLGIDAAAAPDDATIRSRYAELVRRSPPERDPATFQKLRAAYEALADRRARLRFLLFEPSQGESLDEWIDEIRHGTGDKRLGLGQIRAILREP